METIELIKNFLSPEDSKYYYNHLSNDIKWYNQLLASDGTLVRIKRKMAYMEDKAVSYHYARLSFEGQEWTPQILALCHYINGITGRKFNSVLLNWYKDGKDEIKWHSDKEEQLGINTTIYAINLGATRKFWFLNKETGNKDFYYVEDGDLLKMNAGCQEQYLHAILPEKEIKEPRISLTFREVVNV